MASLHNGTAADADFNIVFFFFYDKSVWPLAAKVGPPCPSQPHSRTKEIKTEELGRISIGSQCLHSVPLMT